MRWFKKIAVMEALNVPPEALTEENVDRFFTSRMADYSLDQILEDLRGRGVDEEVVELLSHLYYEEIDVFEKRWDNNPMWEKRAIETFESLAARGPIVEDMARYISDKATADARKERDEREEARDPDEPDPGIHWDTPVDKEGRPII